ncbi:sugar phosphate isomerase/epimerase family protein [Paenibacillus sp. CAU 1782]
MTVGLLAHLLGKQPYDQLAGKVADRGFNYVQLALSKAIADIDFSLGKLSPGLANEIGGAFANKGVGIAVLGCYASLIELDDESYRYNVDRFKEHLRHARHFGAPIVATEVGVPADPSRSREHWEQLNRALEEIVEEAERWGVTIGLEAADRHLIGCVDTMAETLERFPSSCVGVVIDPCNLLNAENFERRDEIIEYAFSKLGKRIVSAHAKDLQHGENGGLSNTAAGLGDLHYDQFWSLLEAHKPHGFVTLEDVREEQMAAASRFVREGRKAAR